ncbi:hypothetical protein BT93_D0597 [Corymbia citriodora subsp. variegata]|nr:hypothetical protein BT93_D0597 [Corymbia citriodora subsp. variegata]
MCPAQYLTRSAQPPPGLAKQPFRRESPTRPIRSAYAEQSPKDSKRTRGLGQRFPEAARERESEKDGNFTWKSGNSNSIRARRGNPIYYKSSQEGSVLENSGSRRRKKRQAESARIREKYPDRIPVIVERAERSDVPDIDKKKYLVPADLTAGQFVYVVRKRIKLSAEKAIFVFVKNTLPPTAALMSAIYEENKDEDGFLYMTYSGENTFGFGRPQDQ